MCTNMKKQGTLCIVELLANVKHSGFYNEP